MLGVNECILECDCNTNCHIFVGILCFQGTANTVKNGHDSSNPTNWNAPTTSNDSISRNYPIDINDTQVAWVAQI